MATLVSAAAACITPNRVRIRHCCAWCCSLRPRSTTPCAFPGLPAALALRVLPGVAGEQTHVLLLASSARWRVFYAAHRELLLLASWLLDLHSLICLSARPRPARRLVLLSCMHAHQCGQPGWAALPLQPAGVNLAAPSTAATPHSDCHTPAAHPTQTCTPTGSGSTTATTRCACSSCCSSRCPRSGRSDRAATAAAAAAALAPCLPCAPRPHRRASQLPAVAPAAAPSSRPRQMFAMLVTPHVVRFCCLSLPLGAAITVSRPARLPPCSRLPACVGKHGKERSARLVVSRTRQLLPGRVRSIGGGCTPLPCRCCSCAAAGPCVPACWRRQACDGRWRTCTTASCWRSERLGQAGAGQGRAQQVLGGLGVHACSGQMAAKLGVCRKPPISKLDWLGEHPLGCDASTGCVPRRRPPARPPPCSLPGMAVLATNLSFLEAGPAEQCGAVHGWLVVAVGVLLPLGITAPLELRARQRQLASYAGQLSPAELQAVHAEHSRQVALLRWFTPRNMYIASCMVRAGWAGSGEDGSWEERGSARETRERAAAGETEGRGAACRLAASPATTSPTLTLAVRIRCCLRCGSWRVSSACDVRCVVHARFARQRIEPALRTHASGGAISKYGSCTTSHSASILSPS